MGLLPSGVEELVNPCGRLPGRASSADEFRPGESAGEWLERAIVANSVAAAQEESVAEKGNPTAKRVAAKRADEASADLNQALRAVQAEQQQARESS